MLTMNCPPRTTQPEVLRRPEVLTARAAKRWLGTASVELCFHAPSSSEGCQYAWMDRGVRTMHYLICD